VSRKFREEFGGRPVVEASQEGTIVTDDEGVEVGVAFGMVANATVVASVVLRHSVEMLTEAAVKNFRPCRWHAAGRAGCIPGTFMFDAKRSRQGYDINMFYISLMKRKKTVKPSKATRRRT
jgi:hypothetical protein